jgi:hypothetical protein
MVEVELAVAGRWEGRCWYDGFNVCSEPSIRYEDETWPFDVDTLALMCTRDQVVWRADAYLPGPRAWGRVDAVGPPGVVPAQSFRINSPFDERGGHGSSHAKWSVSGHAATRSIVIGFEGVDGPAVCAASPHDDLVMTAAQSGSVLVLSQIWFMNVKGYPS